MSEQIADDWRETPANCGGVLGIEMRASIASGQATVLASKKPLPSSVAGLPSTPAILTRTGSRFA